jgi:hypothetical protein
MKIELNKLLENRIYNHEECVSKIEELADELAIGFLEFEVGLLTKQVEGYFYFDFDNEWKTSKELLEIYKKTLG